MTNNDIRKVFTEELYDEPGYDMLLPDAYADCVRGIVYDLSGSNESIVYDYGKMCAVFSKQTGLKLDVVTQNVMPDVINKFNKNLRVPVLAVCFASNMKHDSTVRNNNELVQYLQDHDATFGPSAEKLILAADNLAAAFTGITVRGEVVYDLSQAIGCYMQTCKHDIMRFDDTEFDRQNGFLRDAVEACRGKAYIVDLFV